MEFLSLGLGFFSIIMIIAYYSMAKKLKSISSGFAILYKDYMAMKDIALSGQLSETVKMDHEIHKESFIKFLSDSRDWAFDYIEDVQSGLKKFIDQVGPEIDYYNKYGIVVEGMIPAHDAAFKKISKEFDDLKKLLPEESDDRR